MDLAFRESTVHRSSMSGMTSEHFDYFYYYRYPTGKAEEAEKWMNAILEYKPDFIPPKHPGFVCSQHFILGSKTNLLPTVPGNSLEEHQKGRAADESTATVSEDHSYATTNGLNKSTANLVFTICLDGIRTHLIFPHQIQTVSSRASIIQVLLVAVTKMALHHQPSERLWPVPPSPFHSPPSDSLGVLTRARV